MSFFIHIFFYDSLNTTSNEETRLEDYLVVLKKMLQYESFSSERRDNLEDMFLGSTRIIFLFTQSLSVKRIWSR